jgi:cytochrome P450
LKDRVIRNSRWLFGNGLLTNEGDPWKKQRRLAQPAFHRERIAFYGCTISQYAEQAISGWQDGAVVDVHQEMMRLTLAITTSVLFDVEAEGLEEISKALNVLARHLSRTGILLPSFVRLLPSSRLV